MKVYLVITCLFLAYFTQAQGKKPKKEIRQEKNELAFKESKNLIESLNYEFVANQASPQEGRTINLTTNPNHLKIIGDSIDSYLPYFGRSHSADYGNSDSGIKCSVKYTKYEVIINEKKLQQIVKFSGKGNNDSYEFSFTISSNGSATLYVSSNKKSGISYFGNVQEIKPDKKQK